MRLDIKDAQILLKDLCYYWGVEDGVLGKDLLKAVEDVREDVGFWPTSWTSRKQLTACVQTLLNRHGFEAGPVDGVYGHNTHEALEARKLARLGRESYRRPDSTRLVQVDIQTQWPANTTKALEDFYGPAGGVKCTQGLVRLPIPFVLAWDPQASINMFRCHGRVAQAFTNIFKEAVHHYGSVEYRRLRLDRFGGCFNNRNMRGGSRKSTHAYGAAVDLDPENNRLK